MYVEENWKKILFTVTILAVVLRIIVAYNAVSVATDSVSYLFYAKFFLEGDFAGAINDVIPPFYPFMSAVFGYLLGDIELGGRVVSVFFGSLSVVVIFFLGKKLINKEVGILMAFMASVHPYMARYSGDVLTEGLYYFLFSLAVLLIVNFVEKKNSLYAFLSAIVIVLSYLTRPEAIALLVLTIMLFMYDAYKDKEIEFVNLVKPLVVFVVTSAILVLPYLYFLYVGSGEFTLSGKISNDHVVNRAVDVLLDFNKISDGIGNLIEAFTIPYFLFAIVGVRHLIKKGITRQQFTVISIYTAFIIIYFIVLPQRRYFVEMMTLGLFFPALGFIMAKDYFTKRFKYSETVVVLALLLIVSVVQLPRSIVKIHSGHSQEKQAGLWLLDNGDGKIKLMSEKKITCYYGDCVHMPVRGADMSSLVENVKDKNVQFLAGYDRHLLAKVKGFEEDWQDYFDVAAEFNSERKGSYKVYRIK